MAARLEAYDHWQSLQILCMNRLTFSQRIVCTHQQSHEVATR